MAARHTVVVFPNPAERDRACTLLQSAGHEVEVLRVPAGLAGVGVAAIHFPEEQEHTRLHLIARQHVLIGGTDHVDADQIQETPREPKLEDQGEVLVAYMCLTMVLPCLADHRKIRARAEISHDISAVMPYLNALLPSGTYNAAGGTFTFTEAVVMVTLYPKRVEMAKADDILDALHRLSSLREWINETWANRASIAPSYERHVRPHALQVYPYLPAARHNCRQCGEWTCLAFAVKVVREMEGQVVGKCQPLREDPLYREQRDILYALLRAGGYEVPAADP